jgi:hypothetical protein
MTSYKLTYYFSLFQQWKKKLAKIKATARFRAAYLTISLASKFNLPNAEDQEGGGEEKVKTPSTPAPVTPAE